MAFPIDLRIDLGIYITYNCCIIFYTLNSAFDFFKATEVYLANSFCAREKGTDLFGIITISRFFIFYCCFDFCVWKGLSLSFLEKYLNHFCPSTG